MRKLILQEWLSLDGHATDKNGSLDFLISPELNKYSDLDTLEVLQSVDLILLGAVTYRLFVEFWPGATTEFEAIADKLNSTAKVVFSKSLLSAPWGKWPEARIIHTDLVEAVKNLKSQEGGNIILWGSLSIAQALISAGLIDEFQFRICPVATGSGRSLFSAEEESLNLELTGFKHYESGLIALNYIPKQRK